MDYRLFIYSLFLQLIGFINGLPQTVMVPSLSSPTSSSTRTSSFLDTLSTASFLNTTTTSWESTHPTFTSTTFPPAYYIPEAPTDNRGMRALPLAGMIVIPIVLAGVLALGIFLLLRIRQRKKDQLQAMAIANGEVAATEKPNGLVSLPTEEVKNTGSGTSPADTPTVEVVAVENTIDLGLTVSRRLTL